LTAVARDPLIDLLIAAVLTWATHSSVTIVLFVMSLASAQIIAPDAALAMVLGANLGSAINPVVEGTGATSPEHRRLPIGNLANRVVGCVVGLILLQPISHWLGTIESDPARMAADFHTLFNLVVALVFMIGLKPYARLLTRLLPAAPAPADPGTPIYLDPTAVAAPSIALSGAARETLRMGDLVEAMLRQAMTAFMTDDRKLVAEIERMDDAVDRLHEAVKLYVTRMTRESLDERDSRRAVEIVSFAINLEHIGDIVDKNLSELATKKIKRRFQFSAEGAEELSTFHRRIMDSLRIAFGVFMSGEASEAHKLLAEKAALRNAELAATERHLERLREGRPESLETTSLHLDVLRDLKRIHSHICSVAYPVLDAAGQLEPYRHEAGEPAVAAGVTQALPR
jgi:phosphate:Na+ symporter